MLRRTARAAAALAFAAYAWTIFAILALIVVGLVTLLPRLELRWRAARGSARLLARLTGTAITVHNLDRLPPQPSIVVSNHPSWLDPVVLGVVLPCTFRFIATSALERQVFAGFVLGRLDTQFVERREPGAALTDTERLAAAVRAGRSIVIFPEGGLARRPGLRPFRMGAFVAAAEAGAPVVPVGIRGTRSILPPRSTFPRHGAVEVAVGRPLRATRTGWAAAVELQRRARDTVLDLSGEPDVE